MTQPPTPPTVPFDWDDLRCFLHAARAKSLSSAARSLSVEHSTIGRRLTRLEAAVGVALVRRGPTGLELTDAGRRVFRLTIKMEAAAAAVTDAAVASRSVVRLVVPTGFTTVLTSRIAELTGVSLDIVSSARKADLRRGRADIAIRIGPVDDPALVVRSLGEVGSALYASRAYLARRTKVGSVDVDDLSGHAVVGFHRSLASLPAAQWLAARIRTAEVVMHGRDAADMLAAAQSGVGLAVLPCLLADRDPGLVRLTREPIAKRRLSLVYAREARTSTEVREVVAFIVDVMRAATTRLLGTG